jgi:Fibronectin type III domain
MSVRKIPLAAGALVLAAVLVGTAAARGGPSTPTNLRITGSTDTSVSLAWDASRGSSNFWYCVQRNASGCVRVDPPRTTMTWPNLPPNTTSTFSVYAITSAGHRSGNSNSVSYTTPPDTTPPSPTPQLTLTSVRPTRFAVTWTPSTDNVSQVFYTLFVNGAPQFSGAIGVRSWVLLDRTPETTYLVKVRAADAFGNFVESNTVAATTPAVTDHEPPTAPTNFTLSPESSPPEIWTDWTQSTDDVDPQSDILYDVYFNGVFVEHGALGGSSTITYCLDPGPTAVTLKAVDSSGNVSGPSNEIVFDC